MNLAGRTTIYDAVGRRVGSPPGLRRRHAPGRGAELYRPFLGAVAVRGAARRRRRTARRNLFVDDAQVAEYGVTRAGAGFDLGIAGGRRAELRVGVEIARERRRAARGRPLLPEASGWERTGVGAVHLRRPGQPGGAVRGHATPARASGASSRRRPPPGNRRPSLPASRTRERFDQAEFDAHRRSSRRRRRNRLFARLAGGTSFDAQPVLQRLLARRTVQDVGVPQRRTARRALRTGERRLHAAAARGCRRGWAATPTWRRGSRCGFGVRHARHGGLAHDVGGRA